MALCDVIAVPHAIYWHAGSLDPPTHRGTKIKYPWVGAAEKGDGC